MAAAEAVLRPTPFAAATIQRFRWHNLSHKPNAPLFSPLTGLFHSHAKKKIALSCMSPCFLLMLNSHEIKIVIQHVVNQFSFLLLSYVFWYRRGYAVASDVSSSSSMRGGMSGIEKGVAKNGSGPSSAWAPDPVTGYYRPINHRDEIDPVELRKMLLNHKGKSS